MEAQFTFDRTMMVVVEGNMLEPQRMYARLTQTAHGVMVDQHEISVHLPGIGHEQAVELRRLAEQLLAAAHRIDAAYGAAGINYDGTPRKEYPVADQSEYTPGL